LIIGERFITPKSTNGVLQKKICYSDIQKISFGFTEFTKPYILMHLTQNNSRTDCYIFTFDTYEIRNQCICTILWRADCYRIIDQILDPKIDFKHFEQNFIQLLRTHRHPSKLTSLTLEHLQITIHNASALEMLSDSVAEILVQANPKLLSYLATSSEFIENLGQFLQYNPIPCPQLSKILEMYCMYRNKTRESLKVIRETVIKALHSSTLHPYKHCPNFTTNVTRAKAKEIRESLMRLTLVYINCATGCLMPDLKVNQQQQNLAPNATQTHCSEEHNLNPNTLSFYFPSPRASIDEVSGAFVRELHGNGKCPHLLTLDNIYQIARFAINECYCETESGCCLVCPSECPFTPRISWAEMGIKILIHAAAYEDWCDHIVDLIAPFPFPKAARSCKVFGNLVLPLLDKLMKYGGAMKLSGISCLSPEAMIWLKFSSKKLDSSSTCFSPSKKSELFRVFLVAFHALSPQIPPAVLKTLADL
jgi:hypothetical protein